VHIARQDFISDDSSWTLDDDTKRYEGRLVKFVSDFENLLHHFLQTEVESEGGTSKTHFYYLHEDCVHPLSFEEYKHGDDIVKFQREGTGEAEVMLWNNQVNVVRICSA
jgi:hypothetical protein